MTFTVKVSSHNTHPFKISSEEVLNRPLSVDLLKSLPKVDLHRHLEGSLRLETLVETARLHDIDVPRDIELLRPFVQVTDDPPGAAAFLAKFETLRHFYCTPETIYRLAYEVIADAARDNIKYLELRFSPQALSRVRGFSMQDVTDWVINAGEQACKDFDIEVNYIITLVRHDPLEQAWRVAQVAFDNIDKGVVGLDLAGDEIHYPANPFKDVFLEAKKRGLGITIHAGEWCGADTVRFAAEEIGADRIGHGVRSIEDPKLFSILRDKQVALEICLTSNMQTASVASLKQHPIKMLLDKGVPVTLNTDDPRISDVTLTDEYEIAQRDVSLSYQELRTITLAGIQNAFTTPERKRALMARFVQAWKLNPADFSLPKPNGKGN